MKLVRKLFSKIKKFSIFPLKIVEINGCVSEKNSIVRYQVSGKATNILETPDALINELAQIAGFSKLDSDLILQLFVAERSAPNLTIKNILFSENGDEFEIKDIPNRTIMRLSSEAILNSEDLMKQFSYKDLMLIQRSYLSIQIKNERTILKKSSLPKNIGNIYVIGNKKSSTI